MGDILDFKIIRYDIQLLNESGAPVRQYDVPKIEMTKAVKLILKAIEEGKVYAVNIKKHETEH